METKKTIIVSIITTLATLFVVAVIMHLCCGNCGGQSRCSKDETKCSSSYNHCESAGKCASYTKMCKKKCEKMDSKCEEGEAKCTKGVKCCQSKEAWKMGEGKSCSKDKAVEVTVTETVKK